MLSRFTDPYFSYIYNLIGYLLLNCWLSFFEFISGGGNGDNSSEFDDFVGAQNPSTITTPKPDDGSKTNGNQNGTGNSHTNFFGDFDIVQTGNGSADNGQTDTSAQKQAMSKDSIMALFNQKPAQSAVATGQLPVNQKQFEFPANLNMVIFYTLRGYQLGNPKIDWKKIKNLWIPSQVFDFFSFGPPYEMKNIKVV